MSTLMRVDRLGNDVELVDEAEALVTQVESYNDLRFLLTTRSAPAIYRYTLTFSRADGTIVDSYGSYLRTVLGSKDVRVSLTKARLKHEKALYARLDNLSTGEILFEPSYLLQQRLGGLWRTVGGSHGGVGPPAHSVVAGQASKCVKVPLDRLGQGKYRLVMPYYEQFPREPRSEMKQATRFSIG